MTRSLHFEAKAQREPTDQIAIFTLPYEQFTKGCKSLHFEFGWPFYIAPYEQFFSDLPKPRKEPNGKIFCRLAIFVLRRISSLSATGQAKKGAN